MRQVLLLLASLLVLAAGCEHSGPAPQSLVIISPHREEIRDEVAWGFQDWLRRQPGHEGDLVRIEWRDIGQGSTGIVRYLSEQYKLNPAGVGIDLLFGGGTDIYLDFKERGRLEKLELPPALAARIPQRVGGVDFRDPDGYWYGVMLSSLGILYNQEMLARQGLMAWAPPSSWRDLGDPRLLGSVSACDPRMSGSVRMLYEVILQNYGWDEGFRQLMRLAANSRGFVRTSDGVTKDVVFGRAIAGGTLDSYGYSAVTRDRQKLAPGEVPSLVFVFPRNETLLSPDSIGILKGAPHLELAKKFVEYNLSEEGGQRLWMLRPGVRPGSPTRYPICRLGVMPALFDESKYPVDERSVPLNPFDEKQIGRLVAFDNKKSDGRRNVLTDLCGAWFIDVHAELHAAWRAVVRRQDAGLPTDHLERRLFEPPCTENELPGFTQTLRRSPRHRAELLTRWLSEARQRYHSIRQEAEAR